MTYGDIPPYSTIIFEFELLSTDLAADEETAIATYRAANPDMLLNSDEYFFKKLVTIDDNDLTLPDDGDLTTVLYTGYYTTGNPFDSNKTGFAVTIGNGAVVEGFDYAVRQLKIGEKCKILIPSGKAYGETGSGNSIPPYTPLIFVIERIEY
jgi:FKBP-type peptidyl-prolyl cis-trans isomerase